MGALVTMTGEPVLDLASMAVSLFNTIVLIWLGLTVALNAHRLTTGIWIVVSQLLLAGIFFLSHTVILSRPFFSASPDLNFWWRVGWLPVVALPYAWYGVMLWYGGFWENRLTPLYRRHMYPFIQASVLVLAITAMVYVANPIPLITQLAHLDIRTDPSLFGIPLIVLIYPIYIGACIALSIDALRRPAPSARIMGDLARQRAKPWLMSASIILALVGLLVGGVMFWAFTIARAGLIPASFAVTIAWSDLVIASLIASAVLMVGQAIVSYEVFTGQTLPRRGLRQHWKRIIILAGGFSVAVAWGLTYQLSPVYLLLLSAILIAVFYALLSWRSFIEREEYLSHLRPFVRSQELLDQLLSYSDSSLVDSRILLPFQYLCSDLLQTQRAALISLGAVTQVFGGPVFHPPGFTPDLPDTAEITARIASPSALYVTLDPLRWGGLYWALPLWSDRGLIGILMLGEKIDRSLFTQEEFEIARATGERLLDTQASLELSRRLVALQRQRLSRDRLLDHQTRRILHDEVLPLIHTAMIDFNKSGEQAGDLSGDAMQTLQNVHRQIAALIREMPHTLAPELEQVGLAGALERMISSELPGAFDQVTWQVDPQVKEGQSSIPGWVLEVVYYAAREAIRNAGRHAFRGQPDSTLVLDISMVWKDGLEVRIRNNGNGNLQDRSTSDSGQGLSLHSTMLAVIGGMLAVETMPDNSTQVVIRLPEGDFLAPQSPSGQDGDTV